MATIGYARVSTREQNLRRQLAALEKAGCTKIFEEKQSGKSMDRPELKAMLDYIRDDDEIVVVALDRLGRDAADLTTIIATIQQKGASLNVLNLPSFAGVESASLRSMLTNLTLEIYKYIAQNEREAIHQRQAEGIAAAKADGVYKGKPAEYSDHARDPQKRYIYKRAVKMLQQDPPVPKAKIARELGISRPTVYRIAQNVHL